MQPTNERYTKSWSMTFGAYILSEVKESVMVTGYHGDDQVHDRMLGEDVVPVREHERFDGRGIWSNPCAPPSIIGCMLGLEKGKVMVQKSNEPSTKMM